MTSLVFTLGLVLWIGMNDIGKGFYDGSPADIELVESRIANNCLQRTRANDLVVAAQARPYDCFRLEDGNDKIYLDQGENLVHPGPGRDIVIVRPGAGDTQIVHGGGRDTYTFGGGGGIFDLRPLRRGDVTLSVVLQSPGTVPEGQVFDPSNRPASDLLVTTPAGAITVAGHFLHQPLELIVLEDSRIDAEEVSRLAVSGQQSEGDDRIYGTGLADTVSPGAGNDRVELLAGDNVVTYSSGHDIYDAGPGRDILNASSVRSSTARFSISDDMRDILVEIPGKGSVRLVGQAAQAPSSETIMFASLEFSDDFLSPADMLARAVSDPASPGDDRIIGSMFSDDIRPGTGTNTIHPGPGSDTIRHGYGRDTIVATGTGGRNILVFEETARGRAQFRRRQDDLVIETDRGSSVTVENQFSAPAGSAATPVHLFRFAGEDLPDDVLRQLFFSGR